MNKLQSQISKNSQVSGKNCYGAPKTNNLKRGILGMDRNPYKPKAKRRTRAKKPTILLKAIFVSILCLYAYFVCPLVYESYFRPIILNRILNRNLKLDVSTFYNPSREYLHNSYFLDKYFLMPVDENARTIKKIYITSELTYLKEKTQELFDKYPNLEPSIFVVEYSTGKGFEINSETPYPSASIIKVPILFNLIRNIDESSQTSDAINLDDKMIFSEEYRTSGSGILQKAKADTEYTIDYLADIMISESDNSATNMLLYKIGGINGFNRFARNMGLENTSMGQWLPDLDGYNKITAKEVSDMLYNIDNPDFVNPIYSNKIKEYLGNTKNTHLIREKLPDDVIVLHKTGNIGSMLGDSGIIYTQNGRKYIMSILVKRPYNDPSAKTLIQDASLLIYNYIDSM